MVTARRNYGNSGEDFVAQSLQKNGYKIIDRNFSFRGGELDIIAEKEGVIYFVEVKSRKSNTYGHPLESITPAKARKIKLTAQLYLAEAGRQEADCRFLFAACNPEQGSVELICDFI